MKGNYCRTFVGLFQYTALIVLSIGTLFPLVWMALSSLKTTDEMFAVPLQLLPKEMQWHHFVDAFKLAPFAIYLKNSIVTSFLIVIFQIGLSCMVAYGLTQIKFKGRNLIFHSLLLSYMLPSAVTYVPSYVILAKLNLLDSLTGIVISNIGSVFSIFLLRQTFLNIPKEVIEAARVEGASDWRILWRVMVPMSKSSVFTLSIITFIQMYNNYLWPSLIVKSQDKYLITVGLRQFFTMQGAFADQWPLIMAVNVITVIPLLIVFIVFQKWLIKGIGDSGVKG